MIQESKTVCGKKIVALLLCAAVFMTMFTQLFSALAVPISVEAVGSAVPELKTFADLSGKTVAMLTGAPFEELVKAKNPDIGEIQYFSTPTDMILALKEGKIDAFLANNAAASMMVDQDSSLAVFPEPLEESYFGFAFKKGNPERDKWQTAYDSIGKERIEELWDIWIGNDESRKVLPEQSWSGSNGTVKVATCDSVPPMSYAGNDGELTGFDIAVMLEIAKVLDVHLEFTGMEFASVMAEIESGKAQVGNASIVINKERKKLMDFVQYHEASYVMVVRAEENRSPRQVTAVKVPELMSFSDLSGKTVAMLTGAPFEELIRERNPDVGDIQYFSSVADMLLALKTGKVDAFLNNNAIATMMMNQDSSIALFPESLGDTAFGFAFKKGDPEREKWQTAYDSISKERIDELWDIWLGTDESKKVLPAQDWSGSNGTVKVATCDSAPPMSYVGDNGELVGFDIAVMLEIAKALDVHLEFTGMEFASVMSEIESGKAKVGASSIVISDERKKLVDFVPYHDASFVLVVRAEEKEKAVTAPEYTDISELNGKTFGLVNGSPFAEIIESRVADVKEYQYFSSIPDMALALKAGKIDAFLTGDVVADTMINQDKKLAAFPVSFGELEVAFALPKDSPDTDKWQAAYEKLGEERIQELYEIWTGTDDSKKVLPEQDWAGTNGTVRVASSDSVPPVSYVADNGRLEGLEIAVLLEMAKILDVHLDFSGMDLSSILASLETGKADIANSCLAVSEERQKNLDLVPYHKGTYVLVVRAAEQTAVQPTFTDSLKESFERTFITDSRWKMILLGLGRTVIMAICAGTLGTLLGFGLVLLRHKNNIIINKLIAIYSSLITGIPVVVILMVMYYIVFGKLDAPALIVAIIGFTIIFGARAYGLIYNAVTAVDEGQREAALALGYSEKLAFRRVILPQSRSIYFPTLKTQFVMLLKETSVAGYITVLEMTRAVDLVRSRTMEAFFPLITAALIYYILTWLLTKIITSAENALNKKREQRKIKGVD